MIYTLLWHQSNKQEKVFLNYYAFALGDMEDDGSSILFSTERNEIVFVPRYLSWDTEEWGKVEIYEGKVNDYLNRSDLKAVQFKIDHSGREPMKLIDPFTGEIASEKIMVKESLSEFLNRGGKILIADSTASNLGEIFYSDNKIRKEDLKIINWNLVLQ